MSSRNIRRMMGGNTLPPPDDDSDDYQPLYVKERGSSNAYDGLLAGSNSEAEDVNVNDDSDNLQPVLTNTEKKKRKKKKKNRRRKRTSVDSTSGDFSLDEIDRSLREVNALLGPPAPAVAAAVVVQTSNLMAVQNKHLDYTYEEYRVFGPLDADEEGVRRRGRQPYISRLGKRGLIVKTQHFEDFARFGLSMSIDRCKDGITYFVFNHSALYQKRHRIFIDMVISNRNNMGFPFDDIQYNVLPDEVLEIADLMFRMDDNSEARKLIERAISYMQFVSHPLFNLSDGNIRLEYSCVENRVFHVAVVKYLHMLTNTMFHRTAMELAKMLMNIDPTDPLGMVFFIDTFALRAREHQWLIDIINLWTIEKRADLLHNMQYSYAMAHFHVAHRKKGDMTRANQLLQKAMLNFPTAVSKIIEFTHIKQQQIQSHPLFTTFAEKTTNINLQNLITIYATMTTAKWREPEVYRWFIGNAKDLINKYDNDPKIQELATEAAARRKTVFQIWPDELIRHMVIIKPMERLLLDSVIPDVEVHGIASNPVPVPMANGNDRYQYKYKPPTPEADAPTDNLLAGFLMSIAPAFVPPPNPEPVASDMAVQAEHRNVRAVQRREQEALTRQREALARERVQLEREQARLLAEQERLARERAELAREPEARNPDGGNPN
ncbi:ribosome quality control complex subunit TCF25 isoform X2 [Achroia grisella]|uniref:ribosome quality control complex subunit TCF25 isoform X2 n=1 Tax=Achroia grisella TaxID=688607 RepID=UPI0027D31493|nr:ribosome quality control complex subunit TCF25 isoform X2 [Achroia grisella]